MFSQHLNNRVLDLLTEINQQRQWTVEPVVQYSIAKQQFPIGCLLFVLSMFCHTPFSRLILAMDPRYGEISRAMRNRGVEIFMLGEVRGLLQFLCIPTQRRSRCCNAGSTSTVHICSVFVQCCSAHFIAVVFQTSAFLCNNVDPIVQFLSTFLCTLHSILPCKQVVYLGLLFLQDEGAQHDDRDLKIMLFGLGLQHERTSDFILTFHKAFKKCLKSKYNLTVNNFGIGKICLNSWLLQRQKLKHNLVI